MDAGADVKSTVGIDLKTTLIMSAVGLSSVVCAFIFTTRMLPGIEKGSLEIVGENNVAVEETSESAQNKTKIKKEEKKTNKEDKKTTEKKDVSNIADDEEEDYIPDPDAESESGKILVPMESIVANLGGVESRRYLRVMINLEVSNTEAQDLVNRKMVMIRDKLISYFSAKASSDIESEGSLFKLRLEIKNSLNKVLGHDKIIKQVYFSDFIVQ